MVHIDLGHFSFLLCRKLQLRSRHKVCCDLDSPTRYTRRTRRKHYMEPQIGMDTLDIAKNNDNGLCSAFSIFPKTLDASSLLIHVNRPCPNSNHHRSCNTDFYPSRIATDPRNKGRHYFTDAAASVTVCDFCRNLHQLLSLHRAANSFPAHNPQGHQVDLLHIPCPNIGNRLLRHPSSSFQDHRSHSIGTATDIARCRLICQYHKLFTLHASHY